MSIKIFSYKGFNVIVTVLSIVIPAFTWLVEKARKNKLEPIMYETAGNKGFFRFLVEAPWVKESAVLMNFQ